jgi:hypothetical protein
MRAGNREQGMGSRQAARAATICFARLVDVAQVIRANGPDTCYLHVPRSLFPVPGTHKCLP